MSVALRISGISLETSEISAARLETLNPGASTFRAGFELQGLEVLGLELRAMIQTFGEKP